jgi:hypothetical protein
VRSARSQPQTAIPSQSSDPPLPSSKPRAVRENGWNLNSVRRVPYRRSVTDVITIYIGDQAMTHYRIYVTTSDGHVTEPPTVIECADDQEAIGKTAQLRNGKTLELWQGARRIARLPGGDDPQ